MSFRPTVLERAYQLARSGECATISELRQRLSSERFDNVGAQLYGRVLINDLRRLMESARALRPCC